MNTQKNISSTLKSNLIYAHYCYLTNHEFRNKYIDCGCKLLNARTESENIYLLASAEYEKHDDLIKLFKLVAIELSVELPILDQEDIWVAEASIDLVKNGYTLPDYDLNIQLKRYFLIFYCRFKNLSKTDSSLIQFNFELGKFSEKTGLINDYQQWLISIQELSDKVTMVSNKNIVCKIVNFILGCSYGAIDEEHLRYCDSILEDFNKL